MCSRITESLPPGGGDSSDRPRDAPQLDEARAVTQSVRGDSSADGGVELSEQEKRVLALRRGG